MLNFSDDRNSELKAQESTLIAVLLEGVAKECAVLAEEISHLGETLSAHKNIAPHATNIVEMQRFDALSQNARAQAQIMLNLAMVLSGRETFHIDDARSLIAKIPLWEVRMRLLAMSGEFATVETNDDEQDDWLFE